MHSLFAPKAKASTASSNNVKLSSVTLPNRLSDLETGRMATAPCWNTTILWMKSAYSALSA